MSRAQPMTPDERREAIVSATLPLLLEQGPDISTSQIAKAAAVAEGTIFRVFDTKADLIHATIQAAMEPTEAIAKLTALDDAEPLDIRVAGILDALGAEISRTRSLFIHLAGAGFGPHRTHPHPPGVRPGPGDGRLRLIEATATALAPYADRLRVPVPTAARLLNALAFASSLGAATGDAPPTTESLANTVLYGIAEGEK